MTNCHRRVLLQKQHCHRLTDNIASADNDRVPAADRNFRTFQYLDNARWRTRDQRILTERKSSNIHRMKTVDVFRRIDRLEYLACIDLRRQRKLDEDAVDVVPG